MMKHLPAEKYNIAWFKLAEFVVRGERERALALYRLLAHSLHDDALALQLEGDILLSFKDPKAVDAYQRAGKRYQQEGRFAQAADVYEHIIELKHVSIGVLKNLVELYRELGQEHKVSFYSSMLIKYYVKEERFSEADELVKTLLDVLPDFYSAQIQGQLILSCLGSPAGKQLISEQVLTEYLEKTLDYYILGGKAADLQSFLALLEAVSDTYAQMARSYLEK